jgi:hypothetical protein
MFKLICKYNIMIETFEDEGGGIFEPIVAPIVGIAKGFVKMGEIAVMLVELVIKVIATIPSIFNPDKLINDVLYGVTNGITSMFGGIINQFSTNEEPVKDGIYDKKNQVCVAPTLINLIILVVCPPLALYKDRGLKGFFLVIVCALLTYYLYYFPGFLFAALHIMC